MDDIGFDGIVITKLDKTVRISIGSGMYVEGKIEGSDNIIVPVGSDIFVEATTGEAGRIDDLAVKLAEIENIPLIITEMDVKKVSEVLSSVLYENYQRCQEQSEPH